MGFYSDFIEKCERDYRQWQELRGQAVSDPTILAALKQNAQRTSGGDLKMLENSVTGFWNLARKMRQAKIIRMSGDQCDVFLHSPRVEGQDFATWLRLPFP